MTSITLPKSTLHELKTLLLSTHPLIVIDTVEEERAEALSRASAEAYGLVLNTWSLTAGLAPFRRQTQRIDDDHDNYRDPAGMLDLVLAETKKSMYLLKDFSVHLDSPAITRKFRDCLQKLRSSHSTIILVGTKTKLPDEIEHDAIHLELGLPTRQEIHRIVEETYQIYKDKSGFQIVMTEANWVRLVDSLLGMTLNQARQILHFCVLDDRKLDASDIEKIMERKARLIRDGGLLEYYPLSQNNFSLGGFANLKEWIERAKSGYGPEAKKYNLKPPKGILITGVQGCGKSLAAKAIARILGFSLLKLDAARLYDKYIGETEANFRKATAMAASVAPVVLWIDEIEKGFAQSEGAGGDSALTKRLFGSLLTWLQEKKEDIFVVATSNDLSQLPPELQRKGRFDEVFFVDLPNREERVEIFQLHLILRNQNPAAFDGNLILDATEGFSGAEIEQVIVASLYQAIYKKVALSTELLLQEIKATVPLSKAREEDIKMLREMARGRFALA